MGAVNCLNFAAARWKNLSFVSRTSKGGPVPISFAVDQGKEHEGLLQRNTRDARLESPNSLGVIKPV